MNKLMKAACWVQTGGQAAHSIENMEVRVDGIIELRKRCKIRDGQLVNFGNQSIKVVRSEGGEDG
ncbi:hypothetical protein CHISP_2561 [Chitinispirillum alkaliphilum]|nr:hypothetical protein CHISP_2561 [Chitinispirillum alkaliphilum]